MLQALCLFRFVHVLIHLNGVGTRVYLHTFVHCPHVSVIVIIHIQQQIDAGLFLVGNDGSILLIYSGGVQFAVLGVPDTFQMDAGRTRIITEFVKEFARSLLYFLR